MLYMLPKSLQYISDMQYSPGGGETIFDFIVNVLNGKGCKLVGLLRNSALEAWNWKCLLLNSSKSRKIHHRNTLCRFSMVMLKFLYLSRNESSWDILFPLCKNLQLLDFPSVHFKNSNCCNSWISLQNNLTFQFFFKALPLNQLY